LRTKTQSLGYEALKESENSKFCLNAECAHWILIQTLPTLIRFVKTKTIRSGKNFFPKNFWYMFH
jgi:hypothetical protein